jgi:hypothetical protein
LTQQVGKPMMLTLLALLLSSASTSAWTCSILFHLVPLHSRKDAMIHFAPWVNSSDTSTATIFQTLRH